MPIKFQNVSYDIFTIDAYKRFDTFVNDRFIHLDDVSLARTRYEIQTHQITSSHCIPVHYFVRAVLQSTRSLFISAARPRVYTSSHVRPSRIFLGYLFSVHHGMESISCRNRSRVTLSDWKPVRRNFRPTADRTMLELARIAFKHSSN